LIMTKFFSSFIAMTTIILFQSKTSAQKVCRKAEDDCMNDSNYRACISLFDRGCKEKEIAVLESCPYQFSCKKNLPEQEDIPEEKKEELVLPGMMSNPIYDSCTKEKLLDDAGYNTCFDLCKGKECCFTGGSVCDDLSVGDCSVFQSCSVLDLDNEDQDADAEVTIPDAEKADVEEVSDPAELTSDIVEEDSLTEEVMEQPLNSAQSEDGEEANVEEVSDPAELISDIVEEVSEPAELASDVVEEDSLTDEDREQQLNSAESDSTCTPIFLGRVVSSCLIFYSLFN